MDAYIKTLQNYNKSEIIYPVTKAGAVYMDDNSATVQDVLQDVASKEYVDDTYDAITPASIGAATSSHTHGNITNAGAIGTTANKAVITTTNGVLTTGTVPVASGGTGGTTADVARTNLDIYSKTETDTKYAPIDSPAFTTTISLGGTRTGDIGEYSTAFGDFTDASGKSSFANGYSVEASGNYSHAYGKFSTANAPYSVVIGESCEATANFAQAYGYFNSATGQYSHAEGCGVISAGDTQHTQGKYNIEDTDDKYAHIVGNGESDDARSNAHTLDWDGNAWYAGKILVGGSGQDDGEEVATKQYVDANSGVFVAEHSVTTSAELEEAYQANKFIVLRVESSTGPMYGYLLQRKDQNSWYFIVHQGTKITAYCYLQNDSWSALGFFGVNPHASTHAADGADPITPASIGAATEQYADSRVFTAVYGTTTLEEVKAAYNSGAMVLCTRSDNSVKYILTGLSDTTAYFMGMGTSSQILYRVYLDTTWHAASFTCAASTHNQAASTVTAGTFAGQVVANSSGQTYSTSLLRNSKLVSAETNPTVNGEICWTYE